MAKAVHKAGTFRILELDVATASEPRMLSALVAAFSTVKPDSPVARMPQRLIAKYLPLILAENGRILVAYDQETPVGFLVFVRDNNITLRFLRAHKVAVCIGWLLTLRLSDKALLWEALRSALIMRGAELPQDFVDEISLLAVRPGYQGRGIGASLFRRLRESQKGLINVKASASNIGGLRFYLTNGFVRIKELQVGTRRMIGLSHTG